MLALMKSKSPARQGAAHQQLTKLYFCARLLSLPYGDLRVGRRRAVEAGSTRERRGKTHQSESHREAGAAFSSCTDLDGGARSPRGFKAPQAPPLVSQTSVVSNDDEDDVCW